LIGKSPLWVAKSKKSRFLSSPPLVAKKFSEMYDARRNFLGAFFRQWDFKASRPIEV